MGVQQIYQELPISQFVNNGTYLYGIDARTESGTGQISIALQEIAGDGGPVVWSDELDGTLTPRCRKQSELHIVSLSHNCFFA